MRRWHGVAQKYLILNSILAAVSVLAVQALGDQNDVIWLCVGTLALLLFIFDAEKTADAVLRDKPSRMVRYRNVYNFCRPAPRAQFGGIGFRSR